MLTKSTSIVFIPGIPAVAGRPYSRVCPVPPPPPPPPAAYPPLAYQPPTQSCQQVPIYGPGGSLGGSGGPSESGASGPVIIGFMQVCA